MGLLVRGRLTTLRPAGPADVDRLVAWHADPEVSRYWDDETFTRDEMEERLARDDVESPAARCNVMCQLGPSTGANRGVRRENVTHEQQTVCGLALASWAFSDQIHGRC